MANYHYVRASSMAGRSPSPSSSTTSSSSKQPISRPLVQAWKALTSSTRKNRQPESVVPAGFVLVTRRRSAMLN
ncbi:hypothetical protein HDZ31DRAFT_61082 [Schizophyllum fasciatum]